MFSNKTYDILKEVAMVWLPAIAVFVTVIFRIWGIPYSLEIGSTIMAVDTLLGAILHVKTKSYNEAMAELDGFDRPLDDDRSDDAPIHGNDEITENVAEKVADKKGGE